jgi:hypothetical protein
MCVCKYEYIIKSKRFLSQEICNRKVDFMNSIWNSCLMWITDMATLRNFDVLSNKLKQVEIHTSWNKVLKLNIKFYSCSDFDKYTEKFERKQAPWVIHINSCSLHNSGSLESTLSPTNWIQRLLHTRSEVFDINFQIEKCEWLILQPTISLDLHGYILVYLQILIFRSRWRWIVSFTLRLLHPHHLLDERLGGPQIWSGKGNEKPSAPAGNLTRNIWLSNL